MYWGQIAGALTVALGTGYVLLEREQTALTAVLAGLVAYIVAR